MRKSLEQLRKQLLNEVAADNQHAPRAFMFVIHDCPYCNRAERILHENSIEVNTMYVDQDNSIEQNLFFSSEFFPDGNFKPRIWLAKPGATKDRPESLEDTNWTYIGGCDDLVKYCTKNGLTVV